MYTSCFVFTKEQNIDVICPQETKTLHKTMPLLEIVLEYLEQNWCNDHFLLDFWSGIRAKFTYLKL